MIIEVQLRVFDNPARSGGVWLSGQPVCWMHPGVHWLPAAVNDWIDNDVEPPVFSSLERGMQQRWRMWRRRMNYCLNNFEQVDAARRWFGVSVPTEDQIEDVNEIRQGCLDGHAAMTAQGFKDSNWGWRDVLVFAIVTVDIDAVRAEDWGKPVSNPALDDFARPRTLSRRNVAIDWRSLPGITAGDVSQIEDDLQVWHPSSIRRGVFSDVQLAAVTTDIDVEADFPSARLRV